MKSERPCYYHLYSKAKDPFDLSGDSRNELLRKQVCPECHEPRTRSMALDAYVVNRRPPRSPLNAIYGFGLGVAARSLLEKIGLALVQEELHLGKIFGPDGGELRDFATFRGKTFLQIRGEKDLSLRVCSTCKRNLYWSRLHRPYLYPAPSPEQHVFESSSWGLILSEELFERSKLSESMGIYIDRLKVLDTPRDNMPELKTEFAES